MKLHPDKCGIAGADEEGKEAIEQRYKAVAIAYEVLSDDKRRREYDSVDAPKHDLPTSIKPGRRGLAFIPAFQKLEAMVGCQRRTRHLRRRRRAVRRREEDVRLVDKVQVVERVSARPRERFGIRER